MEIFNYDRIWKNFNRETRKNLIYSSYIFRKTSKVDDDNSYIYLLFQLKKNMNVMTKNAITKKC